MLGMDPWLAAVLSDHGRLLGFSAEPQPAFTVLGHVSREPGTAVALSIWQLMETG